MRSLLGCERNPKTSFATRTVGVLMCCCRLVPRMWSLNNKVAHVPRVVPIDGSGEIRAAVVRAGGAVGCDGLAEALAVPNTVRNQKYSATTFVFQVLYEQFSYFSNLYFLLVALSQFIPALQVRSAPSRAPHQRKGPVAQYFWRVLSSKPCARLRR